MRGFIADSFRAPPSIGIAGLFEQWQEAERGIEQRRAAVFAADEANCGPGKSGASKAAYDAAEEALDAARNERNAIEDQIFAAPAVDGPSIALQLRIVRAILIDEVEWTDEHEEIQAIDRAMAFLSAQKGT